MTESYRERMARRQREADVANERDPEKLKKWYELAAEGAPDLDIKPEDPDKELQETARVINSGEKPKVAKPTGGGGGAPLDENVAVPEAGTAIVVKSNRNLKPLTPLGKERHRRIYGETEATKAAQREGRNTPTEDEIETHSQQWDQMDDQTKRMWQNTAGAEATAKAVREAASTPKGWNAEGMSKQRQREKVSTLAFDTEDQAKEFQNTGRLVDADGKDEMDWRKPFSLGHITSKQQVGELSPTKAVKGVALDTDSSHLEELDSHLNELMARPSASAPSTLQGNQFNTRDGLFPATKHAMARSAMAHALGMKDAALKHFGEAIHHAGDLAKSIHGVNSDPISDWDKQDGILHKYRSRPWNKGGRSY